MFSDLQTTELVKAKKDWVSSFSTWIGPVVLRGGAIGRTDAKRAVSRRTFEVQDVFDSCFHSRLIRNHKIKNRLYVRQAWAVTKLNLNKKVFSIFCFNRRTSLVLIIGT